jgi:hypothetical protein
MMERKPYQSYGDRVTYQPGGELYAQVPLKLLEILDPWFNALIASFRGWTKTDITRAEFLALLPESLRGSSKRTVTNWWRRFVELGLVTRKRDEKAPNVWEMIWLNPILAGNPTRAQGVPIEPPTAGQQADESPVVKQDLPPSIQHAFTLIAYWTKKGWKVVVDDAGDVRFETMREGEPGPDGHARTMLSNYEDDVREAITKYRHPLRE